MKRLTALCGVAALAAAGAAHAASEVGDVVVTATRVPEAIATAPDAIVIDADAMAARDVTFAAEAIETAPGVNVESSGPFGVAGVRLRGAPTDKTLVLIDGIAVNDASQPAGGFDLSGLQTDDVARIEILEGPQASLWGSDAIGGVVAITTREPDGVSARLEGGSLGTGLASLAVGRADSRWALGASANAFTSSGISIADPRNPYAAYGAGSPPTFAGGTREVTLGARGRIDPAAGVELDASVRYNVQRTDIAGYPPPDYLLSDTNDVSNSRSLLAVGRARISGPLGLAWEATVSDGWIQRGGSGEAGAYGYRAEQTLYRLTLARGAAADPFAFEAGAERAASRASLSSGASADLGDTSAFAVARARPLARLTLSASARYDAPDRYGAVATGRGSGVLALPHGFSLLASGGQGFKTPTISETACDYCYAPAVPLRPERALGWDAGLAWRAPAGAAEVRIEAFGLDIDNLISYADLHYVNIDRVRTRGLEASGRVALPAGVSVRAAYTYVAARDVGTGAGLLRTPRNQGAVDVAWVRGPFDLDLTVRAEDAQGDLGLDGFTPVVRGGFAVADAAAGYALGRRVKLTLKVSNLLGARYQESYGYAEPGRTVLVGVRLHD